MLKTILLSWITVLTVLTAIMAYGMFALDEDPFDETRSSIEVISHEAVQPGARPVVAKGRPIELRGTICVDREVDASIDISYVAVTADRSISSVPYLQISSALEGGCHDHKVNVGLPTPVSSGAWVVVARLAADGGVMTLVSPPFEVKE